MNLVLKKVLELPISIVQELQGGITAELQNDTQEKSDKNSNANGSNTSSQMSLWDVKDLSTDQCQGRPEGFQSC